MVKHPLEWAMSGYNEIQDPPDRYGLIDLNGLMELCGLINKAQLKNEYKQWVEDSINNDGIIRESCWTDSIAVGNRQFVEDTKVKLGLKVQGRKVVESNDMYVRKEPYVPYNAHLDNEKDLLRSENMYYWDENVINSIG